MRRTQTRSKLRSKFDEGLDSEIDHDRKLSDQRGGMSLVPSDAAQRWICKNGDHVIDILPYLAGKNHPEKRKGEPTYKYKYWYHRNVGPQKLRVLCLASMGIDDCPICDYQAQLVEDKADDSKVEALNPKPRMLYNIVCYDRGEEKKGVQVWDEAEFYSQENIMSVAKERARAGKPTRTINFAHPSNGKSISFERRAPKGQNDYPKYIGFKLEDRDYEISNELLEGCYVLDELIPIPTIEEVESILYGGRGKGGVEPAREEDDEHDYSQRGRSGGRDDDTPDPYDLLEDADDKSDLNTIVRKWNLDLYFKGSDSFGTRKRKIKDALDEMHETGDRGHASSDDALTAGEVEDMSWKQLSKLKKENRLDLDLDDFEDEAELADAIIKEMDLE